MTFKTVKRMIDGVEHEVKVCATGYAIGYVPDHQKDVDRELEVDEDLWPLQGAQPYSKFNPKSDNGLTIKRKKK